MILLDQHLHVPWTFWRPIFPIFGILSEKLADSCVISHEMAEITGVGLKEGFHNLEL